MRLTRSTSPLVSDGRAGSLFACSRRRGIPRRFLSSNRRPLWALTRLTFDLVLVEERGVSPVPELRRGLLAFVGEDLGVRRPGTVADGIVRVRVPRAVSDVVPVADRAPEFAVAAVYGDTAKLLDIDVEQVAEGAVFLAAVWSPTGRTPGGLLAGRGDATAASDTDATPPQRSMSPAPVRGDSCSRTDIDEGRSPGVASTESAGLREARKRIRLLEQENEVVRRATGASVAGVPAGKRALPARDRARRRRDCRRGDVPGTSALWPALLPVAGRPGHRCRAGRGVSGECLVGAHREGLEFGCWFLAGEASTVGESVAGRTAWRIWPCQRLVVGVR